MVRGHNTSPLSLHGFSLTFWLHIFPVHPIIQPSSHCPVVLSHLPPTLQLTLHLFLQYLPKYPLWHSDHWHSFSDIYLPTFLALVSLHSCTASMETGTVDVVACLPINTFTTPEGTSQAVCLVFTNLVTLLALISYNTSQAVATVNVTSPSKAVFWTLVHTAVSIVTIFSAPHKSPLRKVHCMRKLNSN